MKKTLFLLCAVFLLFSTSAWALPIEGNTIVMEAKPGVNYEMYVNETKVTYNTFCLEKAIFFTPGYKSYTVDSVGDFAQSGGVGAGVDGDPVSDVSIWLYASFFDGAFDGIGGNIVAKVQNAIWYKEQEIGDNTDYLALIGATTDFSVTGWNIKAVNIGIFDDAGAWKEACGAGESGLWASVYPY